ncbi:MAG: murein biosynthesis integral membrane protein MurJ [Gammaproteobacteria bacterium]
MKEQLLKSTTTVGMNTLLSRVLGFVRDIVVARYFGASMGADAFFVAFRIPNFLRRLFAEGAFSQAFVPVLSEYKAMRSPQELARLNDQVVAVLASVLFMVTLVGVVAAPVLVMVFAPGYLGQADKYALTVELLRLTFPYLFFISLTAFAGAILNTHGHFGVPAFTPVLLNVSLIAAAIWLAPLLETPVMALAWGVFVGGVAQLLFQIPFLYRLRLLPRPRYRGDHEGVRRILRLILPALFGVSVAQINLLIDTLIASFLVTGSVSWLYFSDRLVEFPLGVFGIALATVILPSLSRQHAKGPPEAFSNTLDWALRWVVLIALPASIGLVVLGGPMLATLFHYGEFGDRDVHMASLSLSAYGMGLLGFVVIKVLAPGYYARQDIRTPVRIGVIAMVANMVFNVMLVFPLAHAGLAMATSLSAFLNAALLFRGLRQQGVYCPAPGWRLFLTRVLLANLLLGLVLWFARGELVEWLAYSIAERTTYLTALILGGVVVYLLGLLALGLRPRALLFADNRSEVA